MATATRPIPEDERKQLIELLHALYVETPRKGPTPAPSPDGASVVSIDRKTA